MALKYNSSINKLNHDTVKAILSIYDEADAKGTIASLFEIINKGLKKPNDWDETMSICRIIADEGSFSCWFCYMNIAMTLLNESIIPENKFRDLYSLLCQEAHVYALGYTDTVNRKLDDSYISQMEKQFEEKGHADMTIGWKNGTNMLCDHMSSMCGLFRDVDIIFAYDLKLAPPGGYKKSDRKAVVMFNKNQINEINSYYREFRYRNSGNDFNNVVIDIKN